MLKKCFPASHNWKNSIRPCVPPPFDGRRPSTARRCRDSSRPLGMTAMVELVNGSVASVAAGVRGGGDGRRSGVGLRLAAAEQPQDAPDHNVAGSNSNEDSGDDGEQYSRRNQHSSQVSLPASDVSGGRGVAFQNDEWRLAIVCCSTAACTNYRSTVPALIRSIP